MGERWTGRRLKQRLFEILDLPAREEALAALAELPERKVVNPLFSAICRAEPRVRWRAVTCMGDVVARLAERDMEAARIVIRRMIWQLTEECGMISWGAPEALGESLYRSDALAVEYAALLVSYIDEEGNYLEHPPMQQGVVWGIGRLAGRRPDLLGDAPGHIRVLLGAGEPASRGLTAWALGRLGDAEAAGRLRALTADPAELPFYEGWEVATRTVAALATEALGTLAASTTR